MDGIMTTGDKKIVGLVLIFAWVVTLSTLPVHGAIGALINGALFVSGFWMLSSS